MGSRQSILEISAAGSKSDGLPAGYALFFDCYSSLRGHGISLEDFFVGPKSVGRALLARVARITEDANGSGSCSMFSIGTIEQSSFTEE